jgi:hypothetical protein
VEVLEIPAILPLARKLFLQRFSDEYVDLSIAEHFHLAIGGGERLWMWFRETGSRLIIGDKTIRTPGGRSDSQRLWTGRKEVGNL